MMKNKPDSIIYFAILTSVLLVTSCKKETKVKKSTSQNKVVVASDTIFDRESPYYIFIQKSNPELLKDKPVYFKEMDIDLDGLNEALVAFGEYTNLGQRINNIFVLKNDHGIVKQVIGSFDINENDFFADSIGLIELQNQQQTYIEVTYTKGLSSTGISVFELADNHIKIIRETELFMHEKDYKEQLTDENEDGHFDEYVQHEEKDFMLNYFKETSFVFENGVFNSKGTQNYMDAYPEAIQDVLLQYIRLRSKPPGDNIVKYRINQLCSDKDASMLKWDNTWESAGVRNYYQIRDGIDSPLLDIKEDDNTANATATYGFRDIDKVDHFYQLYFELEKVDAKWQITKVEIIK